MELAIFITLTLLLTLASGFFSSSETALFSISTPKIKTFQSSTNPRYRMIAELVNHPRDLLVTVFMMNTLVNILLQNTVSSAVGNLASWTLKVGLPLVLTLLFGEIIPKHIGLVNNFSISYYVAPTIQFLQNLLAPIRRVIIRITVPISGIMFFFLKKEKTISKEELHHVLSTSEEFGVLHPDEAELIDGYLSLQDSLVKELMRPREEILFYDINEPLERLTYLLVDQELTRVPVCDRNIDQMRGIISAQQYFIFRNELTTAADLLKVISKPFFIPETTPVSLLLRRFEEKNNELAIVVDEYGSIAGLITFEDIIEEVVGEITDRRDTEQPFTKAGESVIIASGKMELTDIEDIFGITLYSENNMMTIGGWLTEKIGDIPKPGTKYETNDFLFQILSAEPNRITRVYIRRLKQNSGNKGMKT